MKRKITIYTILASVLVLVVSYISAPLFASTEHTFSSDGVKIRYVTAGAGEAVVLLHGWMGDASSWGRDAFGNAKLDTSRTQGFQLIAPDLRGHGKSGKPHDQAEYGVAMAEDVVRLLDHMQIEKAHLVSYSSGAFVAGKIVAMHPQRVRSVVFGGQAPVLVGAKPSDFASIERLGKYVDANKDLGPYLVEVAPPDKKPSEMLANIFARLYFAGKDPIALVAAGRGFKDLAVSVDSLKTYTGPVLFIHGANESEHVRERVAQVRRLWGHGELRLIEGGDHITTLSHPAFGDSIRAFLRAAQARPQG